MAGKLPQTSSSRLGEERGSMLLTGARRGAHSSCNPIRSLLHANSGEPLDTDALAELNAAAGDVHLRVRFDAHGDAELVPDERGVTGALAQILAVTYTAMADDTWSRLKVRRARHAGGRRCCYTLWSGLAAVLPHVPRESREPRAALPG